MNMKLDFVKEKTSRCFWLMFLPVMAAMGAANGVAIVVARALGTGSRETAESVVSTSFLWF